MTVPCGSRVRILLVWGADRQAALARARRALAELTVEGVATTTGLHQRILGWDVFLTAESHVGSLEKFLTDKS